MTRPLLALVITLSLLSPAPGREQGNSTRNGRTEGFSINRDWFWYSTGLYYKSLKEYDTALNFFRKSAESKHDLHRVYFQMAGCYFHQQNYELANHYARLSIKHNRRFIKPYLLTYDTYLRLKNYDNAADALESLLEVRPNTINAHFDLGNLYYNTMKNNKKARIHFEKIIEISKNRAVDDYYKEYSHYYLGYIYYNKNQIDKSLEHFTKVVEINPGNSSAVYILATLLMDQSKISEAQGYVSNYLSRYPENDKMNSYMGRILYIRDDPAAVKFLRRGGAPVSLEGILAKSLMLEMKGGAPGIDKLLRFVIGKGPHLVSPHIALGKLSLRANDRNTAAGEFFTAAVLLHNAAQYDESQYYFRKVMELRDDIPETYIYMGRINEERNNITMALLNYTKANELSANPNLITHLGYLHTIRSEYDKALHYFDQAIQMDPRNPKTYFLKGLMYSYTSNYPLAERFMKKAISLNGSDTYHFYLATVLEKQNKFEETVENLKRAIEKNPNNSRAFNYLGYLYAERNIHIEESIRLIRRAIEIEPNNGAYVDSLGWAYYRKGRYNDALQMLLEAEKLLAGEGAPDPTVFDHIGDTYKKIGNMEKAVDYWEKSLKIEKNNKTLNKILEHRRK